MGWDPDTELVGLLDSCVHIKREIYDNIVSEWVKRNNIQPQLKLGDKVNFLRKGQKTSGEIVDIDKRLGTYTIYCESLGHVRGGSGTLGCIVEWEVVF